MSDCPTCHGSGYADVPVNGVPGIGFCNCEKGNALWWTDKQKTAEQKAEAEARMKDMEDGDD